MTHGREDWNIDNGFRRSVNHRTPAIELFAGLPGADEDATYHLDILRDWASG
jgi:hypothetical protein